MRPLLVSSLLLAALSLSACADVGDDTTTANDESDIKKKVTPTGGNGAFEYAKPASWPGAIFGSATFAGAPIKVGDAAQRTPGSYTLQIAGDTNEGVSVAYHSTAIALTAGATVKKQASAVRVRFDTPVTLGSATVSIGNVRVDAKKAWRTRPDGVAFLVLPFADKVRSSAQQAIQDLAVAEGEVKEVVLPTARVEILVDAYDPAFPSPPSCAQPTVTAGGQGATDPIDVRRSDSSAQPVQVVPHGDLAPLQISAYGFYVQRPTVKGQTTQITMNRLEVDHVHITGTSEVVPGTYRVEHMTTAGGWESNGCGAFPTHTGLDLPDGSYRVTSKASTPSGPIEHVEYVSFP